MNRYTKLIVKRDPNSKKRYYKAIKYPNIPPLSGDLYSITRGGDRLDILAHKYYNDKKLWWVIAIANPNVIRRDSFYLEPGLSLRIPSNIISIINKFEKLN